MTAPVTQQPDYAALIAELVAFRTNSLEGQPSDRALATAAGVSPTTIGNWLKGSQFPQEIDPLLDVVRGIRALAQSAGLAGDRPGLAVLDEQEWRRAYQAEARRRSDTTRIAVGVGQARAALERMRPGIPLSEMVDPFQLEVHHAIGSPIAGLPVLPTYVSRDHDQALAEVVAQVCDGTSRIAVLVGGSSTGKTRACWEALNALRKRDEPWRLWHPIYPAPPDAALAELSELAPYTVVWLNEAQLYLSPDQHGEQVAAGLRTLLRDPERSPILVLATLWPNHWNALTARATPDGHAQARELLDGHRIKVPDTFTGTDLATLNDTASRDPRLEEAVHHAAEGQITQYLAGVPVLMSRYHDSAPATQALIHAAMDARRLGAGPRIPLAWLAQAAPGYLTEAEWNQSGDDWLERALDHVTKPCNGIPGLLTPLKTDTPRNRRTSAAQSYATGHAPRSQATQSPQYQLADYLDQHGRRRRAEKIPPIDFWSAASTHAHPADLAALGRAAWARGLYRDSTQLHKHATTHGDSSAASTLVYHLHTLHPADHRPAAWAAAHVALDNPYAVIRLLVELREAGAQEQVRVLAERAAAQVALDDSRGVARLLEGLREAGAQEQVRVLAERAAAQVALDDSRGVARLLEGLREAGAQEQVRVLAERAAAQVALNDPAAVAEFLEVLQVVEAGEQIAALLARGPAAHVALGDPAAVAEMLEGLQVVAAREEIAALLARDPAANVLCRNPHPLARLLEGLREAGAQEQVTVLAERAAADVVLDDPGDVARLLEGLREAGAQEQVTVLAERAAADVVLDDPGDVARLLEGLREAGAQEQVTVLAERAAADVVLDDPREVARLLGEMHEAGAQEQATVLAERDAARDALNESYAVAEILNELQQGQAWEQIAALLDRDPAAHVVLTDLYAVALLLEELREVGAQVQVTALTEGAAADEVVDDLRAVVGLLEGLRQAGAQEQATALSERAASCLFFGAAYTVGNLLDRLREGGMHEQTTALLDWNPAAQVVLEHPYAVTRLLDWLQEGGMHEQVAALLDRNPAAQVALDHPQAVTRLLNALQRAGAHEQSTVLTERLPAAGQFDLFIELGDHRRRFRLGREPDGSAPAWMWDDLA
ncbi:hypothetical protein OG497_39320 [Streptomyces sp. NBC_01242]|uniref:hypothetical protein n=1 Tax=Streptomyces sp. NBC_01242 TaxID=2903795 RepID=UPI00224E0107|nr:hypothetical protein [Streptomyces sp. NBC_01242]MCX4799894.1 hypothetical protein [Streptomyces sp. NBC_01242]